MIWIIGGTKDSRDFLESVSQKGEILWCPQRPPMGENC